MARLRQAEEKARQEEENERLRQEEEKARAQADQAPADPWLFILARVKGKVDPYGEPGNRAHHQRGFARYFRGAAERAAHWCLQAAIALDARKSMGPD